MVKILATLILSCPIGAFAAPIIGIDHVPMEHFAMLKDLGIDYVAVDAGGMRQAAAREALDAAQKEGFKVILSVSKYPFEMRDSLALIQSLADHPAIAYWSIFEEPDVMGIEPEMVRSISEYVHVSDLAQRPSLITLSDYAYDAYRRKRLGGRTYSSYKNTADIIGVSRPGGHREIKNFYKAYVAAEFETKNWWAVISLKQSPEDLKKAVETAVSFGPKGVIYHVSNEDATTFDLSKEQGLQQALKEVNAFLKGAAPAPSTQKGRATDGSDAAMAMPAATNVSMPWPVPPGQ